MMKADIWSFGCIMLEILFYCTPAFYAINNKNQIKMIANFLKQTKNPSNFSLLNCCNMIKDKFKSKNK
jgi:serine/threonine protein kinase